MAQSDYALLTTATKAQLHWSSIQQYLNCGEQWRRRHILGEKVPPGSAAPTGTGTHAGAEKNLISKMETGEFLSIEEISDVTRDATNEAWERDGVRLSEEEESKGIRLVKGQCVDRAIRLALIHHDDIAPLLEPMYVEYPWVLELRGFPFDLAGRMDVIEKTNPVTIRDIKTRSKTPPANLADTSGQLTTYALAWQTINGGDPPALALDFLIGGSKVPSSIQTTTRTRENFHAMLRRIEMVSEGITKEVFLPAQPDNWLCSPRWCGYYPTCKYVK